MEEFDNAVAVLDEIVKVVEWVAVRVRWFCVATPSWFSSLQTRP